MQLLENILRELKEAVVVCDRNIRILLYNSEAKRLFQENVALGLGRSLYEVCAREPVEHSLRILKLRAADSEKPVHVSPDVRFVCATVNREILLSCRMTKIVADANRDSIYVLTFEDITSRIRATRSLENIFDNLIKNLRGPLTNLSAAAENLKEFPDMAQGMRKQFEDVVFRESEELTKRFELFVQESERISGLQWPLSDVYSADLIGCVARRFQKEGGIKVTMTGVPLWLHADSYSLLVLLENLVRFVHSHCNAPEIDIEAMLGDRRVYLDIAWQGVPISQAEIESLLAVTLPDAFAAMTVADVLEQHDSEMWSQKHRRHGFSILRIPLPDSSKQWQISSAPQSERPEFYDFSIVSNMEELGEEADRNLSSLNYVVFDTETTGLNPLAGDEILAIAAVRIVNGRILSGERFERLIKPQRLVPADSLAILDNTEEMVLAEYSMEEVLRQFKTFVNDAVLVAHNASFDMRFLRFLGEKSGIRFVNPVLDTLLLSIVVDRKRTDYTLENISRWLGVGGTGGHTLMEECFTAAQVYIRLLELLEAMEIRTLGKLIAASEKAAGEKRQQFI